jgi:PHD/YefM family antitoxin component YafN of YafNO toxin-antitoxin module
MRSIQQRVRTERSTMARRAAIRPVTAVEARERFEELIRRAAGGNETVVVETGEGSPVVIVSLSRYEDLIREARLARFERASRAAGAAVEQQGLTEDDLERI